MEERFIFRYIKKNKKIIIIRLFFIIFFIIVFYTFISYLKIVFSLVKDIKNTIEVEKNITKNLLNSFLEEEDFGEEALNKEIDFKSLKKISFDKNEVKLSEIKEFCSRICIRNDLYVFLEKSDLKYEINFFSEFNDLFVGRKKKRLEKEILKCFKKIK